MKIEVVHRVELPKVPLPTIGLPKVEVKKYLSITKDAVVPTAKKVAVSTRNAPGYLVLGLLIFAMIKVAPFAMTIILMSLFIRWVNGTMVDEDGVVSF